MFKVFFFGVTGLDMAGVIGLKGVDVSVTDLDLAVVTGLKSVVVGKLV